MLLLYHLLRIESVWAVKNGLYFVSHTYVLMKKKNPINWFDLVSPVLIALPPELSLMCFLLTPSVMENFLSYIDYKENVVFFLLSIRNDF